MKKRTRLLAICMAVLLLLPLFGIRTADASCGTDEWDGTTPLDYRKAGEGEDQIDTYAKCKYCGEWFLYCGRREHTWYQAESRQPTCTRDGYRVMKCRHCGASYKHITQKAYGHRWGEWICTVAPTATERGEEQRECSVCHATETRRVEPTNVYAKLGESCFDVLIAKELLRWQQRYDGPIDTTLDATFAAALKAFQSDYGIEETGELTVTALELMVILFSDDFRDRIFADGEMHEFASGLTAYAVFENSYVTNGDGTHERTSTWTGVRFARGGEQRIFRIPDYFRTTLAPVHEPCRVANDTNTCPCGYAERFQTAIVDWLPFFSGGGTVVTFDDDDDLEPIKNLYYDAEFTDEITWDEFPDALYYLMDVVYFDEKDGNRKKEGHFLLFWNFMTMFGSPAGAYEVTVQALNENDEPISAETKIYFNKASDSELSSPENPEVYDGLVIWNDLNMFTDIVFRVRIWAERADESVIWTESAETVLCSYNFMPEVIRHLPLPEGSRLVAGVTAVDPTGRYGKSEESLTFSEEWFPIDVYRAFTAVNVRAEPNRNAKRIGGLSSGDFVFCYGIEMGKDGEKYLKIQYDTYADAAYANAAFFQAVAPSSFTVNLDFGNGVTVPVKTGIDGRIDMNAAYAAIKNPKNGRVGWQLTGFTNASLDDVLSEGMTLFTEWERDPAYVWVTLHDGSRVSEVPVPINETYPELLGKPDAKIWTTEPDGKGKLVTAATHFTRDMTDLYASEVGQKEIMLGAFANNCAPELRMLYAGPDHDGEGYGLLQGLDILELRGAAAPQEAHLLKVSEGRISVSGKYFKVYSYRLEREGYILAELLYGSEHRPPTVHFDADGGIGAPEAMLTVFDEGYRLKQYPKPSRNGHLFMGWADKDGKFCGPDTRFDEPHVYLKAVWQAEAPKVKKPGVVYAGDGEPYAYYADTPNGAPDKAIRHGFDVLIIGSGNGRYECLYNGKRIWLDEDNVKYYRYVLYGQYDCYTSRSRKETIDAPDGGPIKLYVIGSVREMEHVVSPDVTAYSDFWIARGGFPGTQESEITVCFDPGIGCCSVESLTLTGGNTVSEYDKKQRTTLYRIAADRIPQAYCAGYRFTGWYTQPVGGVPVNAGTVFTPQKDAEDNVYIVYAHYEGLYTEQIMVANGEIAQFTEYSEGFKRTDRTIPSGTVLVAEKSSGSESYVRVRYRGKLCWVLKKDLIAGTEMQMTHVEYKGDRWVRKSANRDGEAYYRLMQIESFVVIGEKNGYYRIAYPDAPSGFAYVGKSHFS